MHVSATPVVLLEGGNHKLEFGWNYYAQNSNIVRYYTEVFLSVKAMFLAVRDHDLVSLYGYGSSERLSCTQLEFFFVVVKQLSCICCKFCLFWFVDSLMENVRVRRAGFAFRQEYDVALQRYKRFFLYSPGQVVYFGMLHCFPKMFSFQTLFISLRTNISDTSDLAET